jgi:ABC-type multidrug transport system fused ATPase/permease subunit
MYLKYIGSKIYIMFILSSISALLGGFGLTLLLPLFSSLDVGLSDNSNQFILIKTLHDFGINSAGRIILFILFIFLFKGAFHFLEGIYRARLQSSLLLNLKQDMFTGFENMNYKYYVSRNTGHFINVINEQINQFSVSFHLFSGFVAGAITVCTYFIIALSINWQFALISFLCGLILLFCLSKLNQSIKVLSKKSTYETGELNKFLVQALHGFKYAISTNQLKHVKLSINYSVKNLAAYLKKTNIIMAFSESIREPIAVGIVMAIFALQILYLKIPFGTVAVAMILFYRGLISITMMQTLWQKVIGRTGSIEIVDQEFTYLHREKVIDGEIELLDLAKGIELIDVSFSYDDRVVLDKIDLFIRVNSTIAIVGESGAGKSTLIDLLTLILKPTSGKLLIDGQSANNIRLTSWRNQIGYVSQDSVMFDDTVANNIGMWSGNYISNEEYKAKIHKAAKMARADKFISQLTNKYETLIGDRGIRLSGGQRQRLFIARELFKNPRLLILDEATSALDTESEKYIQESVDSLKGKTTVVIIAHRLSTIKNVDNIHVLDSGKVIQSGLFDELRRTNDTQFSKMVESQII